MGQKKKNYKRMYNIIQLTVVSCHILEMFIGCTFYSPEPRPVFHSNGHRKPLNKCLSSPQDVLSPQHEKLIHYINECKYTFFPIILIFF